MSQPDWKVVYTTDSEQLLIDKNGIYNPMLEIAEFTEDCSDETEGQLFQVVLEQFVQSGSRLRDRVNNFQPWFEDDMHDFSDCVANRSSYCKKCGRHVSRYLTMAAESVGMTAESLRDSFCSDDPVTLALAHSTVAGCHGYENYDTQPLTMTMRKLKERWNARESVNG
jgi:hypothetical protein